MGGILLAVHLTCQRCIRSNPSAILPDRTEARRFGNEGRRRRAIARAIDLEPVIMELRESGKSLEGIAAELNRLGIRQSRGGINWTPNAVRNALRWSAPLFPTRNKWNRFAQRFE
jgi:hypothetical protein